MERAVQTGETRPVRRFLAGAISHAYIAEGAAAEETAEALAMAVVCDEGDERPCMGCRQCLKSLRGIHPDIAVIDVLLDKKEIVVDQIRALRKDAMVVPNDSDRKAYIIKNAGLMNTAAQNAFLKTLEEPPSFATIILACESAAALLPTILSRGVLLRSAPTPKEYVEAVSTEADGLFEAMAKGETALCVFISALDKMDRNEFLRFVDAARQKAIAFAGDRSRGENGLQVEYLLRAVAALDTAIEYMSLNVGTVHIAGMLLARLI